MTEMISEPPILDVPEPALPASATSTQPNIRLLLDLDETAADMLRRVEPIVTNTLKRALIRNVDAVFWDTHDHAIGAAGLALGVETYGRRKTQITQRITFGLGVSRPPIRSETPLPPAADRPDPVRLAFLAGEDPKLAGSIEPRMLVPLFGFVTKRTHWTLGWNTSKLQLCLDQGVITASSGKESFIQLAITALEGPAIGAYEFTRALAGTISFHLADTDAVQRGYRRVVGADHATVFAAALTEIMSVRDGVMAIGRSATASLRIELASIITSNTPETIHQTRVALRRLRSVLSVFAPVLPATERRDLARDLGTLASTLGETRELDVFLAETVTPLDRALGQFEGEDRPLVRLSRAASVLREQAAAAARKNFDPRATTDLSLRLSAFFEAGIWEEMSPEMTLWLDRPLGVFAAALLRKRHRKLRRMGEALVNPSPDELHALRIESKKLRYVVEFFAPLFEGRAVKRYLGTIKRLQELLGVLNDASVTRNLVPRLAGKGREENARAAGIIAGWTAAEATRVHGRFQETWAEFLDAKRFW